ncbi:anti-sigma-B factor antagonist [Spirochaetia bacterium]|nr:anti-sigma-B factor antagonist [Spirochaetia bacterium]
MEIVKTGAGTGITLEVSGKLSAATAEEFGAAVDAAVEETGALILDFAGVTYLASAGLRVLIGANKKLLAKKGSLLILHAGEAIQEVFEITGLDDVFDIQ